MARGVNHRFDVGFESRNLALAVLLKIESQSGYANLVLPAELGRANLENRDSAFVTEIVYGTLRQRNLYDEIIASAAKRSVKKIDVVPLNILRMTAHQLLTLETPAHAAVDSAVRLTVRNKSGSASGFVNAISRRISERSRSEWISQLCQGRNQIEQLSLTFAHPKWIVEKYFERLGSWDAVERELSANNINPRTTGVIYPGNHWSLASTSASQACEWTDDCRYLEGNPENFEEIQRATGGVQDQGSYLVARALAQAPARTAKAKNTPRVWVDMCAGPGGKAALLSRWAQSDEAQFLAIEISPHRADLITRMTNRVAIADSSLPPLRIGSAEKILLDAPCSGLGALRRRPDARHRKQPSDIPGLIALQRKLLASAVELLCEGGVLAFVTCSPLTDETTANTKWLLSERPELELIDARPYLPENLHLGDDFDIQLWPGLHNTDAMYLALFRKKISGTTREDDRI